MRTLAPARAPAVHVLHPGDVACVDQDERLETLLGSCVAIILTDPRRSVGAMCHIVHARPAPSDAPHNSAYADAALNAMNSLLRGRGINPLLCQAYVYGGGNMFPQRYAAGDTGHVGEQNVAWALRAMAQDGVPVLACDTGGAVYRRLGWTVGQAAPQVTAVAV